MLLHLFSNIQLSSNFRTLLEIKKCNKILSNLLTWCDHKNYKKANLVSRKCIMKCYNYDYENYDYDDNNIEDIEEINYVYHYWFELNNRMIKRHLILSYYYIESIQNYILSIACEINLLKSKHSTIKYLEQDGTRWIYEDFYTLYTKSRNKNIFDYFISFMKFTEIYGFEVIRSLKKDRKKGYILRNYCNIKLDNINSLKKQIKENYPFLIDIKNKKINPNPNSKLKYY